MGKVRANRNITNKAVESSTDEGKVGDKDAEFDRKKGRNRQPTAWGDRS